MNSKKQNNPSKSFLSNLFGTILLISALLLVIYFVLPEQTRKEVKNTIQTEFFNKDKNQGKKHQWNYTNDTKENTQQNESYTSTPKEVQKQCYGCYGDGKCSDCNGTGYEDCDWHDMDNDGYCSKCNNNGQYECHCYYTDLMGKCVSCEGKGYTIVYE